ncbi:MAG: sugar phosphate isomerase/epimerase [Clostridiales bacterium]|nr:sugar phosphate isomerase/epimerase [Clostridiales bacterium]
MNKLLRLCAFADEAADSLTEQLDALRENGIALLELRGANGENVAALTVAEASEMRKQLADAGVAVWSLGSPFGKSPLAAPFSEAREQLLRLIDIAHALEAQHIRVFSFYPDKDQNPDDCLPEAADRLAQACELARAADVRLCHENEKGIVGDIARRCAALYRDVPDLLGVFDPANFIQSGEDAGKAWDELKPHIHYLHIKDALPTGQVVPAGQGAGDVARIVSEYRALPHAPGVMTVEPHLTVLSPEALELHNKTPGAAPAYASRRLAFSAAVQALRLLI